MPRLATNRRKEPLDTLVTEHGADRSRDSDQIALGTHDSIEFFVGGGRFITDRVWELKTLG